MQRLALQQFSLAQQQCAQEVGIYNCPIHNIGLAMSRMRTLELGRYELNHMLPTIDTCYKNIPRWLSLDNLSLIFSFWPQPIPRIAPAKHPRDWLRPEREY